MPDPKPAIVRRPPFYRSLYFQVIAAIVAGVLLGHYFPATGEAMKPLGDGFIKLIKMMIAPVIFCTVVTGIAGMEDMKRVGKTGGLALLYFEVVSTAALLLGLLIVNLVRPGAGMNVNAASLDAAAIAPYVGPGKMETVGEYLLHIIPTTIVGAFAEGDILQVLLISLLFGFALHRFGGKGSLVFELIEKTSHLLSAVVGLIMRVAPIGAFGAMAFTIGKYGAGTLFPLMKLMIAFYLTCLFFIFGVLGGIARAHGFSIFRFVNYIREELLIVLGTSSSESVLPRMITKLEKLGIKKSTVGAGHPHRLFLQPRRHFHLSDDGGRVHRPGDKYAARFRASARPARGPVAHVERRRGRDRERLHRSCRVGLRCRTHSRGGTHAHPGHRPLHVRGARVDQFGRKRSGHDRGRPLVQGCRSREASRRAETGIENWMAGVGDVLERSPKFASVIRTQPKRRLADGGKLPLLTCKFLRCWLWSRILSDSLPWKSIPS